MPGLCRKSCRPGFAPKYCNIFFGNFQNKNKAIKHQKYSGIGFGIKGDAVNSMQLTWGVILHIVHIHYLLPFHTCSGLIMCKGKK